MSLSELVPHPKPAPVTDTLAVPPAPRVGFSNAAPISRDIANSSQFFNFSYFFLPNVLPVLAPPRLLDVPISSGDSVRMPTVPSPGPTEEHGWESPKPVRQAAPPRQLGE